MNLNTKLVLLWLLRWLFIIGLAAVIALLFSLIPPRGTEKAMRMAFKAMLIVAALVAFAIFKEETNEEPGVGGFVMRLMGFVVLCIVFYF